MTNSSPGSEFGLKRHEGLDEAQRAASLDAAASGARVFPCTVFQQGGRTMIATSFPYQFLARQVVADSAAKGGDPGNATNRPLLTDHVKTINNYVKSNATDYILPPLTLNARELPALHVPRGNFKSVMGFMVIGDETRFQVTDGQHRLVAIKGTGSGRSAIVGLVDDAEQRFDGDSMAVVIVVEPDIKRVHQDFADAAQTKQIPASLLAVYNTREPLNAVLTDIVEKSTLLNGRVDRTSKTLPKMSQSVFLLNQVRQFVKEFLFADYALAETTVAKQSQQLIGARPQQDEFVADTLALLDVLTENMDPWAAIADLPKSGGPATKVPDYRQKYVNMTATGLVVIARVAYEIRKNPNVEWRKEQYKRLAVEIDWRRNAAIWEGTIVSSDGKISTNRAPVKQAAENVKQQLSLRSSEYSTTTEAGS
ncbi:DNA sulfur modification protein DndB [Nocardia abscessus]|nr:DNA sulfur modification protein DndB [Nocardia abscessus]